MDHPPHRREIPAAFVHAILRAYAVRALDCCPALHHAGIKPADLAGGWVGLQPFEDLSEYAMRDLDDEAPGWFSRRLPWGSYGMLLRASLPSPDLSVALRRWCRHHNLLTEDIRVETGLDKGRAYVRIHQTTDLGQAQEFALVSVLRNVHGISCWLADSRIPIEQADFPFARPDHHAAYDRMFGGRVTFGAGFAQIAFDAGYLALPVLRDDQALRQRLQAAIPLMARQYRQDRLLSQRIQRLFERDASSMDMGRLAAELGISPRSLQRHLQDEGTSLIALKSRARARLAQELLLRRDLPIKRVAHMVGYRSESSFSRAFRSWTGLTPLEYRQGQPQQIVRKAS
ncbi:AraC family transcriptional regulator [Paracoccus laeviglucosivorans]|uniref:Transcriptional regulator, AraC family n=1 Tax=Paracoccus laeviglucosivorans TaxID=1197861 RepID=A0A521BCM2_9RHOB|nr:AraC family transcriptional regulator [Paracoccus laeviglucosivorans]SMO44490.1 transcriptional regulator, AraC family [Paracoccus laeviglucosivorans]